MTLALTIAVCAVVGGLIGAVIGGGFADIASDADLREEWFLHRLRLMAIIGEAALLGAATWVGSWVG